MNSALNSALRQASRELSVDLKLVEAVYKSYWKFIKEHISELSLTDISQEEFSSVTTNFNIPYIGKLYTDYEKIEKYKRNLKFYQDVRAKKNKANRLSGISE